MSKRPSCPVRQRPFILLDGFDKSNRSTYDGTETVRGLNRLERKWFSDNCIAVVGGGKTCSGLTKVLPYVDIECVRYWIIDSEKKKRKYIKK